MGLTRLSTTPLILDRPDLVEHLAAREGLDDAELDALQRAAVDYIERETRTQVGTASYRMTADGFPNDRVFRVPRPPLVGVTSVKYLDPAGQEHVLDPATYRVDVGERPGRIVLRAGRSWPATAAEAACVTVEFTAGYDAGAVPDTIKHLIRLIVGAWFECREGATDRRYDELPLPFAVSALIQMHSFPEAT